MRQKIVLFIFAVLVAQGASAATTFIPPDTPPGATSPGLVYQFYSTSNNGLLPNFSALTPDSTGTVSVVDITTPQGSYTTNFSVVFSGYITVPTQGTYTFYTSSDDGSELFIGDPTVAANMVVANNYSQAQFERSGTVNLQAGTHLFTVQYSQGQGAYGLTASWMGPGIAKATIPASAFTCIPPPPPTPRQPENPVGTVQGLIYKFYSVGTTTDGTLPVFANLTPTTTGIVSNFLLDPRTQDTDFAFSFSGYVNIPVAGTWTFYTSSDDGSKLFIGTTPVVNNNYSQGQAERSGTILLAAGVHAITVQYAQGGGPFALTVSYQSPDTTTVPKQQIPNAALSYLPLTATPVLAPTNPKVSTANVTVTMTCATPGATIYYTTNGVDPTPSSSVYTTALSVPIPTTVKAMAKSASFDYSLVAATSYVTSNAPVNDNFANAITLSGALPIVATGTNLNATWESGEPNHAEGGGMKSIWYKWVPTVSGNYLVSTAGSAFDTVVAVYTGTAVNALTQIVANDDEQSGVENVTAPAITTSLAAFNATAGTTYYIAIDGFDGAEGSTQLTISNGMVFSVVATTPTASETGPTSGVFTITRTGDTSHAVSCNFSMGGTATEGAHYVKVINEFASFAVGATSATVNITAIDDFLYNPNETVVLTLVPDQLYSIDPTKTSATITIIDNDPVASGTVNSIAFSVARAVYSAPISVAISTSTAGASIRYTLDGSMPTPVTGTLYTAPLAISSTTTLRAIGYKSGMQPTFVATNTYLYTADIINQSPTGAAPPGWPTTWGANTVDYGMNPSIVSTTPTIQSDLKTIPSLCISVKLADLFDSTTGIYANAINDSYLWERPASLELIDPNNASNTFGELCGIRIRGGFSRSASNPKHAFRIFFRSQYNKGSLSYPLFGPSPAQQKIDKFDIRCDQNYSWSFQGDSRECFGRDDFSRHALLDMTGNATRGDNYHLYINGEYWGLYNTEERPEASFGANYYGGNKDDYDTIKVDTNGYVIYATDGNMDAWTRLWKQCKAGLSTNAAYFKIQGKNPDGTPNPAYENLVEIDQLIDYMLVIYYGGNLDAPISQFLNETSPNNWFGFRDSNGNAGFRFFVHDSEHTLLDVNANRIGPFPAGDTLDKSNPQWIFQQCMANAEFRLKVADHARKHLFDGGALTPTVAVNRFNAQVTKLDRAVIGESARWGNAKVSTAFTRNDWLNAVSTIQTSFFPGRTQVVITQLLGANLLPAITAPSYSQYGGAITPGFVCTITNPNTTGNTFYTTDGSDPRAVGGNVAATATAGGATTTSVTLNGTITLRSRVLSSGVWSALTDSTFTAPQDFSKLKVTEIMYNPPDFEGLDGQEFEFIEMKNTGTVTLNLSGAQFTSGIQYTFPSGATVAPGGFIVLVANPADFALKYPAVTPFGTYAGRLSNSGDTLTLKYSTGATIFSFAYGDVPPWPVSADGNGFSIVPINSNTIVNFGDPKQWRASTNAGGSPGADDPVNTVGTIFINEILAHTPSAAQDYIELYNPGQAGVDVSGWYLTDDKHTPQKYTLPAGSFMAAGGYLLFTNAQYGQSPPLSGNTAFTLDPHGETIYLFSAASGNLTGYTHGFVFEAAENPVAIGRYVISTGDEHFEPQISNTPAAANSGPKVGPIVINEVMYSPAAGGDQFIELLNITTSAVTLYDPANPANTWKMNGVGFTFPANVTVAPAASVLLVAIDPTAFRTKYTIPAAVQIFGPWGGTLSTTGDTIELQRPDKPDPPVAGVSFVPYLREDSLGYSNTSPWPQEPGGTGPSLTRINPLVYGNDPINWQKSAANGGSPGTVDTLVPTAPTGLVATTISATQINLVWNDNAQNETSYTVQRSPDGVNWSTDASLGANIITYPDTGLTSSVQYFYRVYASNAFGDSLFSNVSTATTQAIPIPATPTELVATTLTQSQIILDWDDASNNELGFRFERSLDGLTGWTEFTTIPANVTEYTDIALSPSTAYYYRARAYNSSGNSPYSNIAQATTLQARILKPRVAAALVRGRKGTVLFYLNSGGTESSVAFSLTFDPTVLANPVVSNGPDSGGNVALTQQAAAKDRSARRWRLRARTCIRPASKPSHKFNSTSLQPERPRSSRWISATSPWRA